jgi:hypothetical protein
MKMKRRRRGISALAAGIAGFALVLLVSLALNFAGFQGQGQAQADTPLFPTPERTPTPTIPPSPTPLPVLADEVLANPDFSDSDALNAWEFVDVGVFLAQDRSVWVLDDGALLQNRTAAAGNPNTYETMGFIGSPEWSDYTVSARFYDEGNGNAGLVARRQGESFYRLRMLADTFSDTPKLSLERVVDGVVTPLATHDAPGYTLRTWNDVTLSVQGDQLEATLNGEVILEAEDSALSSGQPGLFTRAMGNIRFSDVIVTGQ